MFCWNPVVYIMYYNIDYNVIFNFRTQLNTSEILKKVMDKI